MNQQKLAAPHNTIKFFIGKLFLVIIFALIVFNQESASAEEVPVVTITTSEKKGLSLTKEMGYIEAVISVSSDSNTIEEALGKMKVRGESNASAEKKPYTIKFSEKQDVLGMGKAKKWVLIANCFDPTLERNYLALTLAKKIGLQYTVDFAYVNLYLDDVFLGNYLLTEAIEAKENRVEIDLDKGDFLIEYEGSRVEPGDIYLKTALNGFRFKLHDPEDATEEQINSITEALNNVESVLANGNLQEICTVLDIESFVDFYVFNEYIKTVDLNYSSVYYYYKNGKLYAGPVWDFDLSAGNANKNYYKAYNIYNSTHNTNYKELWFNSQWYTLLKNTKGFQELVNYRYIQLLPLFKDEIPQLVDDTYAQYKESFDANFKVWNIARIYSTFMRTPDGSLSGNLSFLKTWYINRNQWLLDYWGISEDSKLINYMNYLSVYEVASALNPLDYSNYSESGLKKLLKKDPFNDTSYNSQKKIDSLTASLKSAIDSLAVKETSIADGMPYKETKKGIAYDVTVPHVIINQIYGGKKKEAYASHSFIELYNPTDKDINLSGWSLQYRSSLDGDDALAWCKADLKGTIPAHSSYLIRCSEIKDPAEGSIVIDNYDYEWNQVINNKGGSVVLVANTRLIDADSEVFNNKSGKPVINDYIDMVGVSGNDTDDKETIANEAALYYEKAASQTQSKKKGLRRKNFKDTDNNTEDGDFEVVDYSSTDADYIKSISPKCTKDGSWGTSKNNDSSKATAPKKPVIKATAKKNTITVTIEKTSGADGYIIYMKTGKGKYKKIATLDKDGTTKRTYTIKKLTNGTYSIKVKAYKKNGKKKVTSKDSKAVDLTIAS